MSYDIRKMAISAAAATLLSASTVLAQDALVTSQGPDELRSDWVLGASVTSTQGETIGSIEDLILDPGDGSINAAVISVGGFLGFGAKNIAVDWEELQITYDGEEITLDLTREQADDAPEYEFRDREGAPAPAPDAPAGGGAIGNGGGMGGTEPAPLD